MYRTQNYVQINKVHFIIPKSQGMILFWHNIVAIYWFEIHFYELITYG